MADRKAELERKKARLHQMREEKERRRKEKERLDAELAAQSLVGARNGSTTPSINSLSSTDRSLSSLPRDEARASIDRVLADVGIAPVDTVLKTVAAGIGSSLSQSQSSSMLDALASLDRVSDHHLHHPQPTSLKTLSVVAVQSTNIPPKEVVVYAKQTQTLESGSMANVDVMMTSRRAGTGFDYYTLTYNDDIDEQYEEDSIPGMGSGGGSPSAMAYLSHKLPPGILPHGMPEVKDVKPAVTKDEEDDEEVEGKGKKKKKQKEEEEMKRKKELSEEEKQVIMLSEDFHKFFDRSTRLVERALCEMSDANLFVDYTGAFNDDDHEGLDGDKGSGGVKLSLNRCFHDERWTKNRVITSMDWSTTFPELLLASYDKNLESAHDPDGMCLVWNTRFKKSTPEHIFQCQSQVMSATFARFHPNLILGGTYSGQIVLWDNRVGQKRTPVQRSPLSATAHTHPVYCMKVVGTQNAHNLISISTDGRLCSWSLDMLQQPQETLELQHKQGRPVAVTSLAFPAGDVNNFIVGSEEGHVYTACRHGSRAGILDLFEGHQGAPVTGLSTHHGQGSIDFGHLFLTSSIDWTVKLWSLKENRPLYSFEDNGDYVYDVAWSPIHPALFAAVDGNGRLDLWNLNNDTEVATASIYVGANNVSSNSGDAPASNVALNRVSWTQSGLHVTVGDDMGKIWVYDVGESLAVPHNDDWNKFAHTLADIKQNKIEQEDWDKLGGVLNPNASGASGVVGGSNSYMSGVAPLGIVPGGSGPSSLTSLTSMSASPLR